MDVGELVVLGGCCPFSRLAYPGEEPGRPQLESLPVRDIAQAATVADLRETDRLMRAHESGFQQPAFYLEWSRALKDLITRSPGELAEALLEGLEGTSAVGAEPINK